MKEEIVELKSNSIVINKDVYEVKKQDILEQVKTSLQINNANIDEILQKHSNSSEMKKSENTSQVGLNKERT